MLKIVARGAVILGKESLSKCNDIFSIVVVAGESRDYTSLMTSTDVIDLGEKQVVAVTTIA